MEEAEVEFKRWNFEQVKNYVSAFDMAHQQIMQLEGGENNEDEATTKGEMKQIKEEDKSIKIINKDKYILAYMDVINKYDDDKITPLSKF